MYLFGMWVLIAACGIFHLAACGVWDLVLTRIEPGAPAHLEHMIIATGSSGRNPWISLYPPVSRYRGKFPSHTFEMFNKKKQATV